MSKKILIVDDDSVIVQGMLISLELEGYRAECMTTGRRTKEMILRTKPDLIFLDVKLDNGADGRDISKDLKSDATTSHIPIILISANTDLKKETKKCHANGFLEKPFSVDDILEMAKRHLPQEVETKKEKAATL